MKKSPKPGDMNQRMYAVVQQATGLDNSHIPDLKAVERGQLGGIARAKSLTPEQRTDIAKKAIGARWNPKGKAAAAKRRAAAAKKVSAKHPRHVAAKKAARKRPV